MYHYNEIYVDNVLLLKLQTGSFQSGCFLYLISFLVYFCYFFMYFVVYVSLLFVFYTLHGQM